MSFLDFFLGEKKKTASVAKERLQIILAHERAGRNAPDYLPALQRDLVAVISKYVKINHDDIIVNLERQDDLDVLEVKIELPEKGAVKQPVAAATPVVPPHPPQKPQQQPPLQQAPQQRPSQQPPQPPLQPQQQQRQQPSPQQQRPQR